MQDRTQAQVTSEPRILIVGEGDSAVVQSDVLQETEQKRRPRTIVKVGNQLEF